VQKRLATKVRRFIGPPRCPAADVGYAKTNPRARVTLFRPQATR
jgi:hypothetical protein